MANVAYTQTALDRFYENLAYKPWCGDDKSARLVRPKVSAKERSYIAPNPPCFVHWLVFDLDHENPFIWQDKELPPPNLVVSNPSNGKSHLYYSIEAVCVSENARPGPIRYMEAITRGLAIALEADGDFTGRIAKNPLCKTWRVSEIHSQTYNLSELNEYVSPISPPLFRPENDNKEKGRNCALFEDLRYWAYESVNAYRESGSESKWHQATLNQALSMAKIEPDFTYNEIKNTAKSVAKWVWTNYTGSRIARGAMKMKDLNISLKAKQRLAARRTHELRQNKTEQLVLKAIRKLSDGENLPSKASVAQEVGISRQHLSSRYKHLFTLENLKPKRLEAARKDKPVSFGVHQVTADLTRSDKTGKVVRLGETVEKKDEGD